MVQLGGPKPLTDAVRAAGGEVGPRSYWIGSWVQKSGYGGYDTFLAGCRADGVRPLVLFWYWGDDISPSAVKNGVQDRYQGVWKTQATALGIAKEIAARATARGLAPIVVVENEFNKGATLASPDFARYFDAVHKVVLDTSPMAHIMFAPGNWGDLKALGAYYAPQIAKSDMLGLATLLFAPRHSVTEFQNAGPDLARGFAALRGTTGKPCAVYDLGFSSYGGAYSRTHPFAGGDGRANEPLQDQAVRSVVNAGLPVQFVVYRSLNDAPGFNTANYGGEAEKYVGVVRADGTRKPAYDDLLALAKAPPVPQEPSEVVTLRAELAAAQQAYVASQAALTALQARMDEADKRLALALADLAVWQGKLGILKGAIQAAMDSVN